MYAVQAKHSYTQIKDHDSFLKVRENGGWGNTAYPLASGLLHAGVRAGVRAGARAGASTADFR